MADTVMDDGQTKVAERRAAEALIVDVDGFEGPLDLLLTLSRTQKVDLRKVSVLQLARQYLMFVDKAKALRLELAADYLVMAAWLAFLKSRLLLPPDPKDEGPSGEELAAHLAFQLERLQAIRDVASQLMARDQLGRDFFARGQTQEMQQTRRVTYTATLLDLMQGYARIRTRDGLIGFEGDWSDLTRYLPEGWGEEPAMRRSATASTFAASLELVKEGHLEIRQEGMFAPIQLRKKDY